MAPTAQAPFDAQDFEFVMRNDRRLPDMSQLRYDLKPYIIELWQTCQITGDFKDFFLDVVDSLAEFGMTPHVMTPVVDGVMSNVIGFSFTHQLGEGRTVNLTISQDETKVLVYRNLSSAVGLPCTEKREFKFPGVIFNQSGIESVREVLSDLFDEYEPVPVEAPKGWWAKIRSGLTVRK